MEPYSTGTRIGCLILSSTMYVIGTVGNILIIWTIVRVKHLRTIQNMMVAFLAVVDLIIIGYLLPFSMRVLISNQEPDRKSCRFQSIITAFLFSCSILFIMIIALSRYFKICHGHTYKKLFSAKTIIMATVLSCFVAACFASPLWFIDALWLFDRPIHSCIFNRYGNVVYSVIFMGLIVAFPAVVTSICYIQIYRNVKKARNQLHRHWNNGLARKKLTNEEMLAKTQFSVFIVYMFMYFPFGITAIGGQRSDYPNAFHTITIYMCYFNSCINCILYGVLNKNMRKAYMQSLPCVYRNDQVRVAPTTISGSIKQGSASQGQHTITSQA